MGIDRSAGLRLPLEGGRGLKRKSSVELTSESKHSLLVRLGELRKLPRLRNLMQLTRLRKHRKLEPVSCLCKAENDCCERDVFGGTACKTCRELPGNRLCCVGFSVMQLPRSSLLL